MAIRFSSIKYSGWTVNLSVLPSGENYRTYVGTFTFPFDYYGNVTTGDFYFYLPSIDQVFVKFVVPLTQTPTPTLTQTQTPTPTLTQTPSVTPTLTQTPSVTPTLTQTPSVTPTQLCLEFLVLENDSYLLTQSDSNLLTEKNPCLNCVGLMQSEYGDYITNEEGEIIVADGNFCV